MNQRVPDPWTVTVAAVMIGAPLILLSSYGDRAVHGALFIAWSVVISYSIAAYVHELGHVLSGYALGFDITEVRFGAVVVSKLGRARCIKLQFGVNVRRYVRVIPYATAHIRLRLFIFYVSGALANLVASVTVFMLIQSRHARGYDREFLGILWIASKYVFIVNILPLSLCSTNRGQSGDGRKIIHLLSNSDEGRKALFHADLNLALTSMSLPRDWGGDIVQSAQTMMLESDDALSAYAMLLYEHDLGNYPGAKIAGDAYMRIRLASDTKQLPSAVATEIAYLLATQFGDARLAEKVHNLVGLNQTDLLRLEAAQLFANGDDGAALATGQRAIESIQLQPETGIRRAHAAWMRDLMARAEVRRAEATDAAMAAS
jgi:hypothetical protein